VDAIALGRHQHAIQPRSLAAEIAEDVDGAADFAFGLREGFAFLAGHIGRDLVEAAIQDFGGFV
jgi:hypothetical protein